MAKHPTTKQQRRQERAAADSAEAADTLTTELRRALHLDLAAEALLDGRTREQVIAALIGRITRDQAYLAYRKACNRCTSCDGQVQQDIRALALAACWLEEASPQ